MRDKQTQIEREEIAEIIAQNHNLNGEKWDASDYEWAAHCVQMAGYRKAEDVAREIFEEIEDIRLEHSYGEIDGNELNVKLFNLKKKYESEGEG